jgi:hypothetical protein
MRPASRRWAIRSCSSSTTAIAPTTNSRGSSGRPSRARWWSSRLAPWAGPIASGYGWHVVFVESLTPQRTPDYEEIEADVKNAWVEDRRNEVRARMYEAMRARYEVVLPARGNQPSAPPATGVMK